MSGVEESWEDRTGEVSVGIETCQVRGSVKEDMTGEGKCGVWGRHHWWGEVMTAEGSVGRA